MKIYLVHGWTYTLDYWKPLKEALESEGHELIMLKVPGLTQKSDKVWDIEGYVRWMRSKVKSNSVVIAHSNGGRISLAYAAKYKLKHLFLIGSSGIETKTPSMKQRLAKLAKPIARRMPKVVQKAMYKVIGAEDYGRAKANMRKTMQNMLAADKNLPIEKVKSKTTLIWGEKDHSTPLESGLKLKKKLKTKDFHIIKGAGHSPHFTHTETVKNIILSRL